MMSVLQQFSRRIISLSRNNETWAQDYELWSRNPLEVIQGLFSNPLFKDDMVYGPEKRFSDDGGRLYSEIYCSDWWWSTQVLVFLSDVLKVYLVITNIF